MEDNRMAEPVLGRFHLRRGSIIGTKHRRSGINNQDFVGTNCWEIAERSLVSGVVCDGCTVAGSPKSSRNEVGAALLGNFALAELALLVRANIPLPEIPAMLFHRCVAYLGMIARHSVTGDSWRAWKFIETHLLTTLVGFVADEDTLVYFSSGDGVIIVNDDVKIIDHNGSPHYMAYHLVDRQILLRYAPGLKLASSFESCAIPLAEVERFGIATDGLVDERNPTGIRPEDLRGIFEHERSAPAGLQWHLNIRTNQGSGFADDCSAIVLTG